MDGRPTNAHEIGEFFGVDGAGGGQKRQRNIIDVDWDSAWVSTWMKARLSIELL